MINKVRYITEMIFAIGLIFVSYFAWDRIDVEAYEKLITQYSLDDIALSVDSNFSNLVYESENVNTEYSILSVNNYQNREYNANILLEIEGANKDIIDHLMLWVDNECYNLNEIYKYNKDDKYYFLITNVNLNEYEKKNYNLKLLVSDNFVYNDNLSFSYNIIEEIV